MIDLSTIGKVFKVFRLNYPGWAKGKTDKDWFELGELWLASLRRFDEHQILTAAKAAIERPDAFAPTIGEFLSLVPRLRPEHQMAVEFQLPPPTGPDDYNEARKAVNRAYAMRCAEAAGNPDLLNYPITYNGAFPVRQFVNECKTPHGNHLPEHQQAWSKVWRDFDTAFNAPQTWDAIRALGEVA